MVAGYCPHPVNELVHSHGSFGCGICGAGAAKIVEDFGVRLRAFERVIGEETMSGDFKDIVEVVEVGGREVNFFLGNGYRLLTVDQKAWLAEAKGTVYVRKDFRYAMGRPNGVKHIERPPYEPPTATKDGSRPVARPVT